MTCGRDVDAVEIVDDGTKNDHRFVVVQAQCHGAYDAVRIDFESAHPTPSDLQHAVRIANFFDPTHEDVGFSSGGV